MASEKTNWAFGPQLQEWRTAHRPGLTQADFAIQMGKSRAYIAGLENQNMRAPTRDVCMDIARVLGGMALEDGEWREVEAPRGVPPTGDQVWSVAAPDKLRASDQDLWDWHRQQVAAATARDLNPEEVHLIRALQGLEKGLVALTEGLHDGRYVLHSVVIALTRIAIDHSGDRRWWEVDWLIRLVMRQNPGLQPVSIPGVLEFARLELPSALSGRAQLPEGEENAEQVRVRVLARDLSDFWDLRTDGEHFYLRPAAVLSLAIKTWAAAEGYESHMRRSTRAVLEALTQVEDEDDQWSARALHEALQLIPKADINHGRPDYSGRRRF